MIRIIHLSDLHFNKKNIVKLENFYLESLIKDIESFNSVIKVDFIFITGDLVDKGGDSFIPNNCFDIIKTNFLTPISDKIKINPENIIFVPGNHEIQEQTNTNFEIYSSGLEKMLDSPEKIDNFLIDTRLQDNEYIKKLSKFHKFEKDYYSNCNNGKITFFENYFVFEKTGYNIGILAINSAWNCSKSKKDNLFLGLSQLHNAKTFFEEKKTKFNIILSHYHPDFINEEERALFNTFLSSYNFKYYFCGHIHKNETRKTTTPNHNDILILAGRTSFVNPNETQQQYQTGYSIIDINLDTIEPSYKLQFRKYISERNEFDVDANSAPLGEFDTEKLLNKTTEKKEFNKSNLNSNDWFKLVIEKLKNATNAIIYLREFQHPDDAKITRKDEITEIMKIFSDLIYNYPDNVQIIANTGKANAQSKAKEWIIKQLMKIRKMKKDLATRQVNKCIKLVDKPKFNGMFSIYVINDQHILYSHKNDSGYNFEKHEFSNQIIPKMVKESITHEITKKVF